MSYKRIKSAVQDAITIYGILDANSIQDALRRRMDDYSMYDIKCALCQLLAEKQIEPCGFGYYKLREK